MTYNFKGKTAVVTGASRGIGAAIARTLAADGAKVALVARTGDAIRKLADEIGNGAIAIEADMASANGWKGAAEGALKALGEIDILVNNAGVSAAQAMGKVTPEGLDETINVNVRNLILLTDALSASLIRRKGNVVNISSVSSFSGALGQIPYSTSKGPVNAFAKGLDRDKTLERMGRLVPLEKRWGTAQEIADAVAFLASDKAAYITGQVLRVDGGMIV